MFETDEVDDDYFTPVASTSLKNLFVDTLVNQEDDCNSSLKYVPKIQNTFNTPAQLSTCIFACAVTGYEWFGKMYTSKGKLGFAVILIADCCQHNIVLYDCNKKTVSCTKVTPSLEISLKGKGFLSYYDDLKKCWTLQITEKEIKNVVTVLQQLNCKIKENLDSLDVPKNIFFDQTIATVEQDHNSEAESANLSKVSILNRMAQLGKPLLPSKPTSSDISSDSSDNSEKNFTFNNLKQKAIKHYSKKQQEKKSPDSLYVPSTTKQIKPEYTNSDGLLYPLSTTVAQATNTTSSINMFLTEQRISNNELRMNMNQINNKIDQLMKDFKDPDGKVSNNTFVPDIYLKLINEYESKIKFYEHILYSKGLSKKEISNLQVEYIKNSKDCSAIGELENVVANQNDLINKLELEVQSLKYKLDDNNTNDSAYYKTLSQEIQELKEELQLKNNYEVKRKELKTSNLTHDKNLSDIVKNIMNETYNTLALSFKNQDNYTGETIKNVIGMVLKKTTLESLKD